MYRDSFHFSPPPAVKYKIPLRQAANITEVKIHLLPPPVFVQFLQDVGSVKELVGVELALLAVFYLLFLLLLLGGLLHGGLLHGGLLLGGALAPEVPLGSGPANSVRCSVS